MTPHPICSAVSQRGPLPLSNSVGVSNGFWVCVCVLSFTILQHYFAFFTLPFPPATVCNASGCFFFAFVFCPPQAGKTVLCVILWDDFFVSAPLIFSPPLPARLISGRFPRLRRELPFLGVPRGAQITFFGQFGGGQKHAQLGGGVPMPAPLLQ